MKVSHRVGMIAMAAVFAVFTVSPLTVHAQAKKAAGGAEPSFTAADAKTLKGTDPDAIAEVLSKLLKLQQAKGKDALKPAVEPLIDSAWNELRLSEDKRWNLMDIIKVLSLSGDVKAKPLFMHILSTIKGAGNPYTAQAFLLMGPAATVKDLSDSLQSKSPDTRSRAALTLHKMFQGDKTGSFFTGPNRDTIKSRLVANLKDTSVQVRIYSVSALSSFGDASVIPMLEQIEKKDAHKDSGGVYEVRVEATEALKKLRAKK